MSNHPNPGPIAPVRRRAAVAGLLTLSLVVAACGGGGDDPEVTQDTVVSTTSTTTAPTTTTTTPAGPTNPLTGLPATDFGIASQPAIVVKIDNNGPGDIAQPQVGINLADIVFEEEIESDSTRFAAVFHSQLPAEIGPVRSSRVSEVDIVSNLNRPILVDSGANGVTTGLLSRAQNDGVLFRITDNRTSHFRVTGRPRPDNLFVNVEALQTLFPEDLAAPYPILTYSEPTATSDGATSDDATSDDATSDEVTSDDAAPAVGLPLPGASMQTNFRVEWVHDPATGRYFRFQDGAPHRVDDGNAQLSTDNLVYMFIDYAPSAVPGTPQAITIGSGVVWVMHDGVVQTGTWSRPAAADGYTFTADDGTTIELHPGRTWITLAREGAVNLLDETATTPLLEALLVP